MEQEKHGTAEHVEQENGRRKKISVNFMKNRMHIAQKHKIKIVKILKMTKKNIDDLLTLRSFDGLLPCRGVLSQAGLQVHFLLHFGIAATAAGAALFLFFGLGLKSGRVAQGEAGGTA